MDEIDHQIIMLLQKDSKTSMTHLGKQISLSQPAVTERVRKLEEKSIIEGYKAVVNRKKINKSITGFLLFQAKNCTDFVSYCEEVEDVLEIYRISGQYNFLVKIVAETLEDLESLVNDLGRYGESTTLVVLSTPIENRPIVPSALLE
ncbi:AsnC family transcriptional regulator [Salipaludibacillus neizhouensis]|uniref:AsnC family transcriptional regulator n=1 Tax=Salipaludibacillus neizhouensis TaxID=885475 RepID=A0A3A9JVA6_9BACI|nr:Lrp/AsnC family transcriptional regulator [Salipaludibacillus neizhouensis]RKL64854.1 AsnC family transcriptional regulator [Salipaludibacillus neizhouensis]